MNAVETVKADLLPKVGDLLTHLPDTEQAEAASFFSRVFHDLSAVSGEEQLLRCLLSYSPPLSSALNLTPLRWHSLMMY